MLYLLRLHFITRKFVSVNISHLGPISQRAKIDRNCKLIVVAKKSVMSQYKSLW